MSPEASKTTHRVPILVTVIDVETCPEEIVAAHPASGAYRGVWVLARAGGQPRRLLKLAFDGDRITRGELLEQCQGPEFGPRSALPEPEHGGSLMSVVVCSLFERVGELRNALESLVALDHPNYEVLVVDNRHDDVGESSQWVEEYAGVRLLHERTRGSSAARNRGLAVARGEIVAFTDDDVVVDPGWLSALERRFAAHPEEVGVHGLVLPKELETEAQVTFEEYYGSFGPRIFEPVSHRLVSRGRRALFRKATIARVADSGETLDQFSLYAAAGGIGANMAFRAQALRDLGGFDERLGPGTPTHGGEDIMVWISLAWQGHSLGFEPAALVFHVHRREEAQLERQITHYGLGLAATMMALIVQSPQHLGAMIATAPRAASALGHVFWTKLRTREAGAGDDAGTRTGVAGLARRELFGMLRGPGAYLRSARSVRRRRAAS